MLRSDRLIGRAHSLAEAFASSHGADGGRRETLLPQRDRATGRTGKGQTGETSCAAQTKTKKKKKKKETVLSEEQTPFLPLSPV